MANSLFMVESPPLLDPHSDAKIVTFTLRDPCTRSSCVCAFCKTDAILKLQSRPTSKKINSKDSITTTTMENRETTAIEKKKNQLQLLLGKRKSVTLGGTD